MINLENIDLRKIKDEQNELKNIVEGLIDTTKLAGFKSINYVNKALK